MQLTDGVAELHPDSPLRRAALEIEAHVAEQGWDQAPRLFALVPTADLVAAEPHLADQLGTGTDGSFTPVEQDGLPADHGFEDALDAIEWPDAVAGCAAVVERLMLPPEAEDDLPTDLDELATFVAQHPGRREVRLVAAVLRGGQAHSAVRSRGATAEAEAADSQLLEGPDLVPGLVRRLASTLDRHG
ncbi:hypothetical protein HMPREF0063_12054 [Aeromicrobium marinum DSM 15272]|uniref:Uncharacterized protein n=1 Tax=Aeromicrobium marinum DSM 15272 TaxID=585531 RepID=E2SEB8_9ACTN|nr:PPA1309 family protein [Aeromicrobium marinum]EFQ82845.1 hypothetical protein HMPREF0063_12054 [Aeromicrobium marinum DSM 15272]